MKMQQTQKTVLSILCAGLLFTACKKEATSANEEELITTIKIVLSHPTTKAPIDSFIFKDADGVGGNAPSKFDTIRLQTNTSYLCNVYFLNESVSPADNITEEIKEEGADHQLYFTTTAATLNIDSLSTDANNLPLGLTNRWVTQAASKGTTTVTLKHKPGIKASGDLISKGETDIEIAFPTIIR